MNVGAPANDLPSDLGARFDHLLATCWLPAQWATRIHRESELPPHLEYSVRRLRKTHEWRAYAADSQTLCAIGRAGTGARRDPSTATLEVFFLDSEATVYAAGVWRYEYERGWKVYDVPEVSPQAGRHRIFPFFEY